MTDDTDKDDAAIEALFAGARAAPPEVPEAVMLRVLSDARAQQPAAGPVGWRGWVRLLGGAPGIGGLVTATCVGVWLGVSPPAFVPDLAGQFLGATAQIGEEGDFDTLSGFGWNQEES